MVYCNEAYDRYANALWMFWLFIQFPMLISINIYITGRLSLSHASLTPCLPPYTNLHMCSRLISTTFRIFNGRTNNDSIQCQLKLQIGTHQHTCTYIHTRIHTCIKHRIHKMKLVESMVRQIQKKIWTHFFPFFKKNLDFISVSSSVMWSYNRNRFNELQIKKRISCVIWCAWKKNDGSFEKRKGSTMREKKEIIDSIIIESDLMNREKPSNYIDICVHYDKISMRMPLPYVIRAKRNHLS